MKRAICSSWQSAASCARATVGEISRTRGLFLPAITPRPIRSAARGVAASTRMTKGSAASSARGPIFSRAKRPPAAHDVVKLARTGMTAAPRSSPLPLPTSASMSTSAPCSRRRTGRARLPENDVHIVGVSSQAAAHKTLVAGADRGAEARVPHDILVVCGGVIPPADYDFLRKAGGGRNLRSGTNTCAQRLKSCR